MVSSINFLTYQPCYCIGYFRKKKIHTSLVVVLGLKLNFDRLVWRRCVCIRAIEIGVKLVPWLALPHVPSRLGSSMGITLGEPAAPTVWYNVGIASCHTSLVKVLATSIDNTRRRPRPTLEFYHAKSINIIAEPTSKVHVSWKLVQGFNSKLSYVWWCNIHWPG